MNKEEIRKKTLHEVRRTIESAYITRDDYPPFAPHPFEDRPRYHQYILKLLSELENKDED